MTPPDFRPLGDEGLVYAEGAAGRGKELMEELSGVPASQVHAYLYVIMDVDGRLYTGTNARNRASVFQMLSRAAAEWPHEPKDFGEAERYGDGSE